MRLLQGHTLFPLLFAIQASTTHAKNIVAIEISSKVTSAPSHSTSTYSGLRKAGYWTCGDPNRPTPCSSIASRAGETSGSSLYIEPSATSDPTSSTTVSMTDPCTDMGLAISSASKGSRSSSSSKSFGSATSGSCQATMTTASSSNTDSASSVIGPAATASTITSGSGPVTEIYLQSLADAPSYVSIPGTYSSTFQPTITSPLTNTATTFVTTTKTK